MGNHDDALLLIELIENAREGLRVIAGPDTGAGFKPFGGTESDGDSLRRLSGPQERAMVDGAGRKAEPA